MPVKAFAAARRAALGVSAWPHVPYRIVAFARTSVPSLVSLLRTGSGSSLVSLLVFCVEVLLEGRRSLPVLNGLLCTDTGIGEPYGPCKSIQTLVCSLSSIPASLRARF